MACLSHVTAAQGDWCPAGSGTDRRSAGSRVWIHHVVRRVGGQRRSVRRAGAAAGSPRSAVAEPTGNGRPVTGSTGTASRARCDIRCHGRFFGGRAAPDQAPGPVPFTAAGVDQGDRRFGLVAFRRHALADQQIVGVLIPGRARIVVAQHGGESSAPRQSTPSATQDRSGAPALRAHGWWSGTSSTTTLKRLIAGEILPALQIIAADRHFLAGEMVAHQIELRPSHRANRACSGSGR